MRCKKQILVCCSVVLAMAFGARQVLAQTQRPHMERAELRLELSQGLTREPFLSETIRAPIERADPFLAIGVVWMADARDGNHVRISLRGSVDGKQWGEWREIAQDHDA